jgi:ATP-dependent DNA ligase
VHPSTRRKAYDDGLPPPARSAKARPGIRFNEHIEGDGPTVFAHACKLGLEGISSWDKLS